ncbi:bifunctional DNA-formamidopyrimidine glycosylase/DNA-(apurinic or apyrimidinic site) lyase [Lacisediminihabitans changchengi]|uniref:Formamidopyrimidine-DNA glycosylase n=1 Tax=Lacisediminihabitans changchengi TaxID=2787634 RepID=A0A934SIG5_9MICO|nr:bifunctional DNA-formamidopyrimidine glycosylase/DNA-(apurinic or apyrimidinic site) lyase [Lacisediminihabitans changchengi]MBK4346198.1 bifunctional DNA-formamidopyrimidine glycosylase/DNA-(apurinic or apyrimidinic site) lyase [Lacisediminihabitans changchengi]
MPELPEVEVVRAGLEPAVVGARIASVSVFESRSLRRHEGPSEDFIERLEGRSIEAAVRRGKFLWLPLSGSVDEPEALVVHLGMSGQVLLRSLDQPDDSLLRIRLGLVTPSPDSGHRDLRAELIRLDFVDQRIFGSMAIDRLVPTDDGRAAGLGSELALIPSQVAHIARDPLDPAFDDGRFFAALAKRKTGIKRALLDQNLISGIGNIYADESLWASRIHYDQPTNTLSRARAKTLLAEVRIVLRKALAEGGTSFDAQYVNVNGASGYFSHSLNAYGQHGEACPRCGRPIVRDQFMNRGSHYCPFCQRLRTT